MTPIPVKIAFRASSQIPLLTVLQEAGFWAQEGLAPEIGQIKDTTEAEEALIRGKVDFVFGNHISPYIRRAEGVPIAYFGQTVNYVSDVLVSRVPLQSLTELEGKRLAAPPLLTPAGGLHSHPRGNLLIYLEKAGVNTEKITFVEEGSFEGADPQILRDGRADALVVSPPRDLLCRRRGLHTLPLPRLPMVVAITLTGLLPHAAANPETVRRILRALARGIHFFLTRERETLGLLEKHAAERLRLTDGEVVQHLYQHASAVLEKTLLPYPESIANAFRLACLISPGLEEKINPLSLWDLHYLHELHDTGFFRELERVATA